MRIKHNYLIPSYIIKTSTDDLSLLSDEDEITLDMSQMSDTGSTYKHGANDSRLTLDISQMSDVGGSTFKGKGKIKIQ